MSKHGEILELLFEEMDRHDANLRNNSTEFTNCLSFGEGLTIIEMPENSLYADFIDAGYTPQEATKAVVRERRKLGLGG